MILGLGVDLVDVLRLGRALDAGGAVFEQRVFTEAERADAGRRRDRVAFLAARFAAKEACLKALGTGIGAGHSFLHVEIADTDAGDVPTVSLRGPAAERASALGVRRVHLAVSEWSPLRAATVVLEG